RVFRANHIGRVIHRRRLDPSASNEGNADCSYTDPQGRQGSIKCLHLAFLCNDVRACGHPWPLPSLPGDDSPRLETESVPLFRSAESCAKFDELSAWKAAKSIR